jgi:hypothetical protein
MRSKDRSMAQTLEAVLDRHHAATERALLDLRKAGFERITSIEDAYTRLEAQRHFAGFTQDQIDTAMYAIERAKAQRAGH